jgi:histidinol phosphatase-like PHP family hydrolase/predicted phosphodiesterase
LTSSTPALDLLIIADLHYVGPEGTARPLPERKGKLAAELAERAVRHALRSGRPDAIVLLGDLLEDGTTADAREELAEIRRRLSSFEIPLLVVPGNHDRDPEMIAASFGCHPGIHDLGDYRLVIFSDHYDADEHCSRSSRDRELLAAAAETTRPLIVLQHPPLLPLINAGYPYTILAAEEIAADYADRGVCLSLSGHYHAGQALHREGGVNFITCPAICERPFSYQRIKLSGGEVESLRTVALAAPPMTELFDAHMHTEFAYCAEDTSTDAILERADAFGMRSFGILEHADQLYFPREGFWKRADGNQFSAIRRARAAGHSRHEEYRRKVWPLRSERVFIGLECEPEAEGKGLAVFDEDLQGYDYLLGGIHYLDKTDEADAPQAEIVRRFMARSEQVVRGGIDVLAHPFRYFRRKNRPVPTELYRPLAEVLQAEGVAAEINFHSNQPDPEFFAICLELGVRISIGSDAHSTLEIADLLPHLEFLESLGIGEQRGDALWKPHATS